MKKIESLPLVIGLPGTTVTDDDMALLERVRPAGVILFSRNIETPEQTRKLVTGLALMVLEIVVGESLAI